MTACIIEVCLTYLKWYDIYLREDTASGRLYGVYPNITIYTPAPSYSNDEFLLCDMSLSEGDTFTIPSNSVWNYYYDDGMNMIVDSVTFASGKKVIHLTWDNGEEVDVQKKALNALDNSLFPRS